MRGLKHDNANITIYYCFSIQFNFSVYYFISEYNQHMPEHFYIPSVISVMQYPIHIYARKLTSRCTYSMHLRERFERRNYVSSVGNLALPYSSGG